MDDHGVATVIPGQKPPITVFTVIDLPLPVWHLTLTYASVPDAVLRISSRLTLIGRAPRVVAGCCFVQGFLQLTLRFKIELLIPAIRFTGLLPKFVGTADNFYSSGRCHLDCFQIKRKHRVGKTTEMPLFGPRIVHGALEGLSPLAIRASARFEQRVKDLWLSATGAVLNGGRQPLTLNRSQ